MLRLRGCSPFERFSSAAPRLCESYNSRSTQWRFPFYCSVSSLGNDSARQNRPTATTNLTLCVEGFGRFRRFSLTTSISRQHIVNSVYNFRVRRTRIVRRRIGTEAGTHQPLQIYLLEIGVCIWVWRSQKYKKRGTSWTLVINATDRCACKDIIWSLCLIDLLRRLWILI